MGAVAWVNPDPASLTGSHLLQRPSADGVFCWSQRSQRKSSALP